MYIIRPDTSLFSFQLCVSELTVITKETETCWWLFTSPGPAEAPAPHLGKDRQPRAPALVFGNLSWPLVISAGKGGLQPLQPGLGEAEQEFQCPSLPRDLPRSWGCPANRTQLWLLPLGLPLQGGSGGKANPDSIKRNGATEVRS